MSVNPLSSYTLTPFNRSDKVMASGVTIIALFFIGYSLYGHFHAPDVWGVRSYIVLSVGSVLLIGGLTALVLKNLSREERKGTSPKLKSVSDSTFSQKKEIDLSKMVVADAYKGNGLIQQLKQKEIVFKILENLDNLTLVRVMSVCKTWYLLISKQEGIKPRLVSGWLIQRIESHCRKYSDPEVQMSDFIKKIFVPRSDFFNGIPLITDMQKVGTALCGATGYPEPDRASSLFLSLFEREKAPVLKGQDTQGRWWFLIRVNLYLNSQSQDGVIIYFQRYTGERKNWQPVNSDELKQALILDNGHYRNPTFFTTWFAKLFQGLECGAHRQVSQDQFCEDETKGKITLWKPSSDHLN